VSPSQRAFAVVFQPSGPGTSVSVPSILKWNVWTARADPVSLFTVTSEGDTAIASSVAMGMPRMPPRPPPGSRAQRPASA
jgi:hypothetical protein